jgi:hypothetical protein
MNRAALFFIVRVTPDGDAKMDPLFATVRDNYLRTEFASGFDFVVKLNWLGEIVEVSGPTQPNEQQIMTIKTLMSGWIVSFFEYLDWHGPARYESVAWFAAQELSYSMPLIFSSCWYGLEATGFEFNRETELSVESFDYFFSCEDKRKVYFILPPLTPQNVCNEGAWNFAREYYKAMLVLDMNMVIRRLAPTMSMLLSDVCHELEYFFPGRKFHEDDLHRITQVLRHLASEIPIIQVEAVKIFPPADRLYELSEYQGFDFERWFSNPMNFGNDPYLRRKLLEYALRLGGFLGPVGDKH